MAKKQSKPRSKNLKKATNFSRAQFSLYMLAFALVGVFTLWVSLAAPHGGSGNNGSLSVKMVVDYNSDGLPNWNDQITFNVSTTATDRPWVKLNCYQNGTWVSTSTAGFFPEYAWAPNFTLASGGWTSGAGDCTAILYMVGKNGKSQNLASLNFHVNP